jgi:hypothetical protein
VFLSYAETTPRTVEDMDEIFIQNPGIIVYSKLDLTQRERPQAFIDAERRRITKAVVDTEEGRHRGGS